MKTPQSKTKDTILAQLNSNLPVVVPAPEPEPDVSMKGVSENTPTEHALVAHAEEDYDYVRAKLKKLVGTASESIETCAAMAADSEHPRAYEVLANMIKHTADIAASLTTLQKERRKMYTKVVPVTHRQAGSNRIGNGGAVDGGNTTNNAIFVGSTTELQKFLKAQQTEEFVKV
jgi:hypothetical protein